MIKTADTAVKQQNPFKYKAFLVSRALLKTAEIAAVIAHINGCVY